MATRRINPLDAIEHLSVAIGPRLGGTEESRLAAEYIAEQLDAIGLDTRLQPFSYVGWSFERMPRLELLTPARESIVCAPRAYAQASQGPIVGKLWRDGRVEGSGSNPFGFDRLAVGEDGQRRASIFILPLEDLPAWSFPETGLGLRFREPALNISKEDGARLVKLLDEGEVTVRFETFGHDLPGVSDSNVIGSLAGSSAERIVVGGHYDSVWRSPGAADNAAGVAVMLAVAQRFVADPPACGAELIGFAGEELGLFGSHWYVREAQIRGELDNYKGMVNCDPAFGPGDTLECSVKPDELGNRVSDVLKRLGIPGRYPIEWAENNGSDHYPFWLAGVPACSPIFLPDPPEYHQPTDTIEHVQRHMVETMIDIVEAIAREMAAADASLKQPDSKRERDPLVLQPAT